MKIPTSTLAAAMLLSLITLQAEDRQPFASEESLRYTINWPSGLDLGDARLAATQSEEGAGEAARWSFELDLEAAIPGFQVKDHIRATADSSLCSLELDKQTLHGERTAHERTVFDQGAKRAKRSTLTEGGGRIGVRYAGVRSGRVDVSLPPSGRAEPRQNSGPADCLSWISLQGEF